MLDESTQTKKTTHKKFTIESLDGTLEVAAIHAIAKLLSDRNHGWSSCPGKEVGKELREAYLAFTEGEYGDES